MRLHPLFSFSLSLAAMGLVNGAPTTATQNSQVVTIQRFPLKQPNYGGTEADTVQKLTNAMSKLKTTNRKKIEHVYVGVVDGDGVAEQVFFWNSQSDATSVDTINPFTSFSSTGTVNSSTSVFNDKNTLLRAMDYQVIESVVLDILPNLSTSDVEHYYSVVIDSIVKTGLGLGGSHGIQQGSGSDKRTFMVLNGWKSQEAVTEWADGVNKDPDTAPVYDHLLHSFVGGLAAPLFKPMKEVH